MNRVLICIRHVQSAQTVKHKNITELPAGSILLYNVMPDEFYVQIKAMVKDSCSSNQALHKHNDSIIYYHNKSMLESVIGLLLCNLSVVLTL